MSYLERQNRKGRRAKTPAQLRRALERGGVSWSGWPTPGLGRPRGIWAWPAVGSAVAEVGRAMLGHPEGER